MPKPARSGLLNTISVSITGIDDQLILGTQAGEHGYEGLRAVLHNYLSMCSRRRVTNAKQDVYWLDEEFRWLKKMVLCDQVARVERVSNSTASRYLFTAQRSELKCFISSAAVLKSYLLALGTIYNHALIYLSGIKLLPPLVLSQTHKPELIHADGFL
ncbi:hypothetical protein GQX74_011905 [Glossina fuscipes]|nr:hypothetical protein GQX74_011905 [Glossina fuscipes]